MTTIDDLTAMKGRSEKFASITAYDFSFAKLIDSAGIEMVLIGDSLGNVIQGRNTTIPVSVDEMAYHTEAVRRGIDHSEAQATVRHGPSVIVPGTIVPGIVP